MDQVLVHIVAGKTDRDALSADESDLDGVMPIVILISVDILFLDKKVSYLILTNRLDASLLQKMGL